MTIGYWCLHCETCTVYGDHAYSGLGIECPHCDAGHFDMWRIRGEFVTGQVLEQGSDDFLVLHQNQQRHDGLL